MFSETFLIEIEILALQIAERQRGEDHMQDLVALDTKFKREREELSEASEQWDELPDVAYYTACMMIVAKESVQALRAELWLISELDIRGVSGTQLESGTLAKYRLRAVQDKDIEAERVAILADVRGI